MITIKRNWTNYEPWEPPFFKAHPDQQKPQPVELRLDEEGVVHVVTTGEIGPPYARPADVWHGRTISWYLPPAIRRDALDDLIEEITPLLAKVHGGHLIRWNGHNITGNLNQEALAAYDAIYEIIDERYNHEYLALTMDIREFIDDPRMLREMIQEHNGNLDAVVNTIEEEARENQIILIGDLEEYIREVLYR